jgi:hypothetical protein
VPGRKYPFASVLKDGEEALGGAMHPQSPGPRDSSLIAEPRLDPGYSKNGAGDLGRSAPRARFPPRHCAEVFARAHFVIATTCYSTAAGEPRHYSQHEPEEYD